MHVIYTSSQPIHHTISDQINSHLNHTYILYKDFNRDIVFTGRKNGDILILP